MSDTTRRGVTPRTARRSVLGAAAADTIAQQLGSKPTHSKDAPSNLALVHVVCFTDLSDASTASDNNTEALQAAWALPAAPTQLVQRSEEFTKTAETIHRVSAKTVALRAMLHTCSSINNNKAAAKVERNEERRQAQPEQQAEPDHQQPKEQELEHMAWVSQVVPRTAEEEEGWRKVEKIITSSTPQPETEESIYDQSTSPVPAAVVPLLPEAQEEPSPPAQPTVQDKALSGKQAQEQEETKAVEFKLLNLSLATGGAGSLIVSLTPAVNTFSTTAAGQAAEEEDTAAPVLPEPFKPVESCVCAGAASLIKLHESSSKALTCKLTVNNTTGRISLSLTSLGAATHQPKAQASKFAQLKRGLSAAASCARKVAVLRKLPTLPKLPRETHQARSSEEESAGRPVPKARSWVRRLLKGSALVAAVRVVVRS